VWAASSAINTDPSRTSKPHRAAVLVSLQHAVPERRVAFSPLGHHSFERQAHGFEQILVVRFWEMFGKDDAGDPSDKLRVSGKCGLHLWREAG